MARGDHIVVARDGYTHHGIDVGDGTVVHWALPTPAAGSWLGALARKDQAEVRQGTLAAFAGGEALWVREYVSC